MDIAVAQQCLRENENAVLATWQHDGRLQMSPVTVGLVAAGRVIIASRETTYKVWNLRRDPRATLCVFVEAFTGPWVQICVLDTFFHLGGFGLYTQLGPHDTIHFGEVH